MNPKKEINNNEAFFRRKQVSVQSGFPAWSLKSVFFGVQTTPTNQTPYFSTQGLASCEKKPDMEKKAKQVEWRLIGFVFFDQVFLIFFV